MMEISETRDFRSKLRAKIQTLLFLKNIPRFLIKRVILPVVPLTDCASSRPMFQAAREYELGGGGNV